MFDLYLILFVSFVLFKEKGWIQIVESDLFCRKEGGERDYSRFLIFNTSWVNESV